MTPAVPPTTPIPDDALREPEISTEIHKRIVERQRASNEGIPIGMLIGGVVGFMLLIVGIVMIVTGT